MTALRLVPLCALLAVASVKLEWAPDDRNLISVFISNVSVAMALQREISRLVRELIISSRDEPSLDDVVASLRAVNATSAAPLVVGRYPPVCERDALGSVCVFARDRAAMSCLADIARLESVARSSPRAFRNRFFVVIDTHNRLVARRLRPIGLETDALPPATVFIARMSSPSLPHSCSIDTSA
jgi:hypothetical protein